MSDDSSNSDKSNKASPRQLSTGELATGQTGSDLVDKRYRLIALLGQGGMGNVYKARDIELDEIVALKTLKQELVGDATSVARFRAEVKLARRVTHPNVARTFDIGMSDDIPYLTMEFIDGEDLSYLLANEGRLTVERFLKLAQPVAEGLAAAHSVGVVHRDLKPANIIVCDDGRVVLTDFGIARASQRSSGLTGEGIPIGTPAYMAPEQVQGDVELDHRADIYALGLLFFEMLTGKLPFVGKSPVKTALARVIEEPPDIGSLRKDLPVALVETIGRCLMRDRNDRFERVDDLLAMLDTAWLDVACGAKPPAISASGAFDSQKIADLNSRSWASRFGAFGTDEPRHKAVAVLPFRSSNSDEDIYVADGLTEDLIDELSMSQSLKVRPRGAVMPYKQSRGDEQNQRTPRAIGEALGVDVIVDGSIRRSGQRLRVRVALVSVDDGFQIWAKRFKGSPGDLFEISEDAARAIVDALTADELATPKPALADSEAVDLYLEARHVLHASWFEDMGEAVALFEKALAAAPDDPRILSGAALAHARATFYDVENIDRHFDTALAYARRALAISPERPEARLALARVHFGRLDYAAAIDELRQAISNAPSNADAHDLLGRILREIGPLDRALRHFKTAVELNPNLVKARWDMANIYAFTGRWELVDELLARDVHTDSQRDVREASRIRTDSWRDQPKWLEADEGRPLTPASSRTRVLSKFGRAAIRTGELSDEHRAFYEQALAASVDQTRFRLVIHQLGAEIFAGVGDHERALATIERGVDAGLLDLMWLEHCPGFDRIRNDPRFEASRRRVAERVDKIDA
jgi:serine/threonine-protein kinase